MTSKRQPAPDAPARYRYADAAGRHWIGIPGPGSEISEAAYLALPDYARETFTRVGVIAPPAGPAPAADGDQDADPDA